jgi:pyridoxine/pyridoxamine 5'-phosphate oxidase
VSLHDRTDYETAGLEPEDLAADPLEQWWRWFREAQAAGCTEPNAMVVSTVDDGGAPDSRYVLVRGADERGVVFYTNYESVKSMPTWTSGRSPPACSAGWRCTARCACAARWNG